MKDGFCENVSVNEGTDVHGIKTILHFEGDDLITQKTYDAQSLLDQCAAERAYTAGDRWGEMRKVGTIPMAEYAKVLAIKNPQERRAYVKNYLRTNTGFVSFDKYLK